MSATGGSMSKLLLGMSFLSLSFLLFFGINDPNSPIMWLASESQGINILRITLMVLSLGLLISGELLNHQLRVIITSLVTALIAYTLHSTYVNTMQFVDTLVIMMSCVSILVACLEPAPYKAHLQTIDESGHTKASRPRTATA
jgi:hypothetical protein